MPRSLSVARSTPAYRLKTKLEQELNSLHAQREAAQAYIKSEAHEGWKLIRDHYDNGGFSGDSLDRPGLQKLLADIREHRVDIFVVYRSSA